MATPVKPSRRVGGRRIVFQSFEFTCSVCKGDFQTDSIDQVGIDYPDAGSEGQKIPDPTVYTVCDGGHKTYVTSASLKDDLFYLKTGRHLR